MRLEGTLRFSCEMSETESYNDVITRILDAWIRGMKSGDELEVEDASIEDDETYKYVRSIIESSLGGDGVYSVDVSSYTDCYVLCIDGARVFDIAHVDNITESEIDELCDRYGISKDYKRR